MALFSVRHDLNIIHPPSQPPTEIMTLALEPKAVSVGGQQSQPSHPSAAGPMGQMSGTGCVQHGDNPWVQYGALTHFCMSAQHNLQPDLAHQSIPVFKHLSQGQKLHM